MQEIQMILSSETMLIVEPLFTDLLQVQKRKQQMHEIKRILSSETLLIVEQFITRSVASPAKEAADAGDTEDPEF